MSRDKILLSEGFYWAPHYPFTGLRDEETLAAICEWDGTPLDEEEEKILLLSQQTKIERTITSDFVAGKALLGAGCRKLRAWRADLRWRYVCILKLRCSLGMSFDPDMYQYIVR